MNEGSFRALKVIIDEGNFMMAKFPAPMASWSVALPTVVDTVITALAQGVPRPDPGRRTSARWAAASRSSASTRTAARSSPRASRAAAGAAGRKTTARTSALVSVCRGRTSLSTTSHVPVPVESQVIVRTGGGGGWGDPLARDPQAVRHDVMEELVSAKSALEDYGVVLRDDLTLDDAATAKRRSTRP